jgi:hypothetical protein
MPNLVSLPTLTLALASLIAIGEPHKSVEIDLRGGEGAQRIVGSQGDFGSKPPVADGVLLSAAPGDLIRVNVNGPTSFTGKTLHMNAEVVKITTHKEGGFFGFFQRTVKTRKTTRKSTQETKTLSIGSEIQIMLEINYKDGSPGLTGPRSRPTNASPSIPGWLPSESWVSTRCMRRKPA